MRIKFAGFFIAAFCSWSSVFAASLTESTITEVINEVSLLPVNVATPAPAKLKDLVKAPDRVRTGAASRSELTAPDGTITRIGANTVFSFAGQGRELNLEKGSLLFHSPKGKGGGIIKSGGASAAVLGTTILVAATPGGGFKVIVLEGRCRVTLPNGKQRNLGAGEIVFVLADGANFTGPLPINLGKLVDGSLLVKGFAQPLPSQPLIVSAVDRQNARLRKGRWVDTGIVIDDLARPSEPGNGLQALDPNTYQAAVPPPLSPAQFQQMFFKGDAANGPTGRGPVVITRSSSAAQQVGNQKNQTAQPGQPSQPSQTSQPIQTSRQDALSQTVDQSQVVARKLP